MFVVKGFDKVLCLVPGKYSSFKTEQEVMVNRGFGLKLLRKLSTSEKSKSVMLECEVVTNDIFQLTEERKSSKNSMITDDMKDLNELLNILKNTPEGKRQLAKLYKNSNMKKWSNFIDFDNLK